MRFWVGDADPVWLVPTVGGSPRPLGEVEGDAGVSADGRHIVFASSEPFGGPSRPARVPIDTYSIE